MADFVWNECCTPTMRAVETIEQRNGVIVNPITFKTKKKGNREITHKYRQYRILESYPPDGGAGGWGFGRSLPESYDDTNLFFQVQF